MGQGGENRKFPGFHNCTSEVCFGYTTSTDQTEWEGLFPLADALSVLQSHQLVL